jgi:uncharacterized membrane protein
MYPKFRLDTMTDGIFAVAMTILILDVKLPEEFRPSDARALAQALREVWPKFFPYLVSFFVLGTSWLSVVKIRSRGEFVDKRYASWWLSHLFLATCLPFATTVIGRFAQYAPAVWLYAANMAALAAVGYRLIVLLPEAEKDEHLLDRKVSLLVLICISALCVGLSFISPAKALWVYLLNIAAPRLARWMGTRQHRPGAGNQ